VFFSVYHCCSSCVSRRKGSAPTTDSTCLIAVPDEVVVTCHGCPAHHVTRLPLSVPPPPHHHVSPTRSVSLPATLSDDNTTTNNSLNASFEWQSALCRSVRTQYVPTTRTECMWRTLGVVRFMISNRATTLFVHPSVRRCCVSCGVNSIVGAWCLLGRLVPGLCAGWLLCSCVVSCGVVLSVSLLFCCREPSVVHQGSSHRH